LSSPERETARLGDVRRQPGAPARGLALPGRRWEHRARGDGRGGLADWPRPPALQASLARCERPARESVRGERGGRRCSVKLGKPCTRHRPRCVEGAAGHGDHLRTAGSRSGDDFETGAIRARRIRLLCVLSGWARRPGRSENGSEGYIKATAWSRVDYGPRPCLEYYEDFLRAGGVARRVDAAALLDLRRRDSALRFGLAYERQLRQRAASLWNEVGAQRRRRRVTPRSRRMTLGGAVERGLGGDLAQAWAATTGRWRVRCGLAAASVTPPWPSYRGDRPESCPPDSVPRTPRQTLRRRLGQGLVEWSRRPGVTVGYSEWRLAWTWCSRRARGRACSVRRTRVFLGRPSSEAELALARVQVRAYRSWHLEPLAGHPAPRARAAAMIAAAKMPRTNRKLRHRGARAWPTATRRSVGRAPSRRTMTFRTLAAIVRLYRESQDEDR